MIDIDEWGRQTLDIVLVYKYLYAFFRLVNKVSNFWAICFWNSWFIKTLIRWLISNFGTTAGFGFLGGFDPCRGELSHQARPVSRKVMSELIQSKVCIRILLMIALVKQRVLASDWWVSFANLWNRTLLTLLDIVFGENYNLESSDVVAFLGLAIFLRECGNNFYRLMNILMKLGICVSFWWGDSSMFRFATGLTKQWASNSAWWVSSSMVQLWPKHELLDESAQEISEY